MRVLAMVHLYPPFHNAGAELTIHPMLRALVQRGHHVEALYSRDDRRFTGPYVFEGVAAYPYEGWDGPAKRVLDQARRPDVIIAHLRNVPQATELGREHGIPVVQVIHNDWQDTRSWLTDDVSLVAYNTEWIAEAAPHPRGIVVHPPIFADDYATTPGDCVTLVNVCQEKGSDVFYALARRFPDLPFLGVKGGLGYQASEEALPNVEIIDHVTHDRMRDEVYARTRVLIMPSAYESFGRVGPEAMCSGIPVIAHPTPGLRESLGEAGIFVDREDLDAWEGELRRVLTRDWQIASQRARARSSDFDPAGELAQWCQAVEALGEGGA